MFIWNKRVNSCKPDLIHTYGWLYIYLIYKGCDSAQELIRITSDVQGSCDVAVSGVDGYSSVTSRSSLHYSHQHSWDYSALADNLLDPTSQLSVGLLAQQISSYRKSVPGQRRAPYTPCPMCGIEVSRANLQRHIRTHTGLKQYSCKECAYRTGDKSNFKRHLTNLHPNTAHEQFKMYEHCQDATAQPEC